MVAMRIPGYWSVKSWSTGSWSAADLHPAATTQALHVVKRLSSRAGGARGQRAAICSARCGL